jgi:hypothetical protein
MRAIALLSLLLLGACCKPETVTVTAAPPPKIVRPELRVKKLKPDASFKEVLEAYTLDLTEVSGYADQLEILIWPKEEKK